MGVPLSWVDAMVEIGALSQYPLSQYRDEAGRALIDEEEIHAKGYTDPSLKSTSLEHVRALMAKLAAG